jgi:hypothetical protein
LDWSVLQMKRKIVSSDTVDSKPVKQEVNGTVILPPFNIPCLNPFRQRNGGKAYNLPFDDVTRILIFFCENSKICKNFLSAVRKLTRGQCYTTFFVRDLRISMLS